MVLLHVTTKYFIEIASNMVGWLVESVFKFSPSNQAYLSNYSYIGAISFGFAVILVNFLIG